MNAANDSPNYLKSNNRYVSLNKQAPSPWGAWRCWIIIGWRDRADTCAFGDLLSHPLFQVCRAGAPSVCILVWVKDPPLAHDGCGHQVLLRQSSIPPDVGQWGSSPGGLSAEWCFQWLSVPGGESEAHYHHPLRGSESERL